MTSPNTGQKIKNPNAIALLLALNVNQNDASLERLDGVRILVNGWRASGTK
jgi:hypothetical protein